MTHSRSIQLTILQAVRGVSALMVVLFHATGMAKTMPPVFRYAFGWGYCGVDFFFVLSGFILLYVHWGQIGHPEKLGSYFGKRFSRIFPAYWSVLALVIPACLLVRGMASPDKQHIGYIAVSVFLLPQWDPFLGVAWSLSCEIFFYLIFALLILNRKSFGLATGVWLALVVTNLVFPLRAPFDFLCQPRVMEFLGGMCIAWTVRKEFRFTKPWSFALICVGVGICFTAGCTQIARGIGGKAYPLWFGLAAVLIISSLVSLELQCATSTGRTWLLLGDASYSIYLIHYPVLILVFKAFSKYAPTNGSWLLAVATAVFSGIVFHLLIEKRVCASARSLVKRERGIQAPPRLAEASHHALA